MTNFDDLKKDDINLLSPNLGGEQKAKEVDPTFDFAQITPGNIPLEPELPQKSVETITTGTTNVSNQPKDEQVLGDISGENNIDGKNGLFVVKDPMPPRKSQKKKKKSILPVFLTIIILLIIGSAVYLFVIDKDMGQSIINKVTGNYEEDPDENPGLIVAPTPSPTPDPSDEPEPTPEPEPTVSPTPTPSPSPTPTPDPTPTPTPTPITIPQPTPPSTGGLG
jgi:hypothetical protein